MNKQIKTNNLNYLIDPKLIAASEYYTRKLKLKTSMY